MSPTDLDESQAPVNKEGPWQSLVLQTGALPTLWMKQVEQDSLGTTPRSIITAVRGIQLERDVCPIHSLKSVCPHSCSQNETAQTSWVQCFGHTSTWLEMLSWVLCRTHHLHAVLSPFLLSGKLHRQPPGKAAGAVWQCGPFHSATGDHSPRRSHERQLSLPSCGSASMCVAWGQSSVLGSSPSASKLKATHPDAIPLCNLADREAVSVASQTGWHLIQRPGKIHDGLCLYMQWKTLKVVGNKVLLSFNVTQDLGAKKRDFSWEPVEMVIFIWEDFQLQWLWAAFRAALVAVRMHHFQGILPVLRNTTAFCH